MTDSYRELERAYGKMLFGWQDTGGEWQKGGGIYAKKRERQRTAARETARPQNGGYLYDGMLPSGVRRAGVRPGQPARGDAGPGKRGADPALFGGGGFPAGGRDAAGDI